MDEILEAVELISEFGLEGVFTLILRLVGLVAILLGIGLWLFTEMGLLVVPLALIVGGVGLLVVPGLLLSFAELAG
ncbi:MAG: hypothetical protein ABEJ86_02010 [Halococcoides sp.]